MPDKIKIKVGKFPKPEKVDFKWEKKIPNKIVDKIKIELNSEEAEIFKCFREYQDIWEEVFKIRSGKAILYFDKDGLLMEARGDNVIFKRKKLITKKGLDNGLCRDYD